jgi:hypothetical protein
MTRKNQQIMLGVAGLFAMGVLALGGKTCLTGTVVDPVPASGGNNWSTIPDKYVGDGDSNVPAEGGNTWVGVLNTVDDQDAEASPYQFTVDGSGMNYEVWHMSYDVMSQEITIMLKIADEDKNWLIPGNTGRLVFEDDADFLVEGYSDALIVAVGSVQENPVLDFLTRIITLRFDSAAS